MASNESAQIGYTLDGNISPQRNLTGEFTAAQGPAPQPAVPQPPGVIPHPQLTLQSNTVFTGLSLAEFIDKNFMSLMGET